MVQDGLALHFAQTCMVPRQSKRTPKKSVSVQRWFLGSHVNILICVLSLIWAAVAQAVEWVIHLSEVFKGSTPGSFSLRVEVSLGKILNPKLLPRSVCECAC